ncbi:hemerythrin [Petropleomorpha daqingensis]|uniref:Pyridoxamine 5'-phosphate oxidase n=1 Tax=Petropleomorpha daqingensis TaxID=2026353 RepID=A0A853CGR4_9ACTN|nr:hemerythrin [Petropleomorpha daqingensis]NYJ07144.1 hypothetical protein [Petropleomorpha daqingensis]
MTALTPTLVDWPGDLAELARRSLVAEYASLTRDGRPITWPVTPYRGEDTGTVDVTTGLTYPAKAERARRDPRVAVLFSAGSTPGPADPPMVLVQGLATVRDADLQANLDRYVHDSLIKLPGAYQGSPRWALRRSAWYFARVYVQLTPLRITSWPGGRLDEQPEVWTAPEGTTAPPSDPAPTGPALGTAWAKPARDWRPFAERAGRLGAPVLTVAGADGWPLPVRCQESERTADGFLVRPPAGIAIGSGPACLTAHSHEESFTGQENVVLVGTAEPTDDGRVHVRIDRALTDWSITGSRLAKTAGFLAKGRDLRKRVAAESARRGQPAPRVRL